MKAIVGILGLLAGVVVITLVVLLVALVASGRLDASTRATIVAALRGEKLVPEAEAAAATGPASTRPAPAEERAVDLETIQNRQALLDRKLRLIDDRQSRLMDAELKLIHDREDLTQQQDMFEKQVALQQEAAEDRGFKTALDVYMKMPPKQAKEDFMNQPVDVVVRYLMNMPVRTQTKILREFKTPAEQERRLEIMNHMRTQEIRIKNGQGNAQDTGA